MKYAEEFTRIQQKLELLRQLDPDLQVFGASGHWYAFNYPMDESEIADYEEDCNIKLPPDYRAFITTIANGGAGPFYGLEQLGSGLLIDLESPDKGYLDASIPFPHTTNFNPKDSVDAHGYALTQDAINSPSWANGLVRLANFGLGITVNLVINGPDYGKTWVDEHINGAGFYPDHLLGNEGRLSFLEWYELWLDQSLTEMQGEGKS